MAKVLMEAFPLMPDATFDTSKKAMKVVRRELALEILEASGIFTAYKKYTSAISASPIHLNYLPISYLRYIGPLLDQPLKILINNFSSSF